MKNLAKSLLIGLLAISSLTYAAAKLWPDQAAKAIMAGFLVSAGLDNNVVQTSFGPVHYLEGGDGENVVFLHGIFARKEHWIDISRQISDGYRIILLDLPGFGSNPILSKGNYDYTRQTAHTLEALDAIGAKRFHIVASSMGGQIAGMIARNHPNRVLSLAFLGSPDGISSPEPSDMEIALASGKTPLVVTTEEEYETRMAWLFPERPFVPSPIEHAWRRAEASHGNENRRIWNEVRSSDVTPLQELAVNITKPALIVWCMEDRIFNHSGANVLDAALPNSTLVSFDKCGHLPMLDRPADAGVALRTFLDGAQLGSRE